jgi:hypothetical protein
LGERQADSVSWQGNPLGILKRHPMAAVFVIAVALVTIYTVITPRSTCKPDLDVRYRVHNSAWVIRELIYHCSALDGQFEISAVDTAAHKTVPLFFIEGDASTSLTLDNKGVVLLVDRFAEIKQLEKTFGRFTARYRQATDDELKNAPKLIPES